MTKILENQHEALIKKTNCVLNDEKLNSKLATKVGKLQAPYSDSNKPFYQVAYVLYSVFSSVSGLTTLFAVTMLIALKAAFIPSPFNWIAGASLGILVSMSIEFAKFKAQSLFWERGFFKLGWSGSVGLMAVIFSVCSTILAFKGSQYIPTTFAASVVVVNLDSVQTKYEARIESKKTELADTKKKGVNSEGRYRTTTVPVIDSLNAQISTLEREMDTQLTLAKETNENANKANLDTNTTTGNWLGYTAIILEILSALCLCFIELYQYKCVLERNMLQGAQPITDNKSTNTGYVDLTKQTGANGGQPAPPTSRKIGFVFGDVDNTENNTENPQKPLRNDRKDVVIIQKNSNKLVFPHKKLDGDIVDMSLADVQKRVREYTEKVGNTEAKLERLPDNKKMATELVLKDQKAVLAYWEQAEQYLLGQYDNEGGENG